MRPEIVNVADAGEGSRSVEDSLLVHNEKAGPAYTALLASMNYPDFPMPMGVLHCEEKPAYDELVTKQLKQAVADQGTGDLKQLLHSGMTWEVGSDGKPVA